MHSLLAARWSLHLEVIGVRNHAVDKSKYGFDSLFGRERVFQMRLANPQSIDQRMDVKSQPAGMRNRMLLPVVSGMILGYLVITIVVGAGVGAMLSRVPLFLTVLTYAGASYLLWLGVSVVCDRPITSLAILLGIKLVSYAD